VSVRALVLSDTHIRRDGRRTLPAGVRAAAADADVVLHAGDVVVPEVLADLADYAPVHAVLGNNDHELVGTLPATLTVELAGVRGALVHDSGPSAGRPTRLKRMFPDADFVVFGHSHLPLDECGIDGQRLFNPGSPTERRRAPTHTVGLLELDGGRIVCHRLVHLDG
jgi:putative phosphoesterase